MSTTLQDIADALGISRQRVGALARRGMPTNSIEAAQAWRDEQQAQRDRGAPIALAGPSLDDGSLASRITRHRSLVDQAEGVWRAAMETGDPNQAKYQTAYNSAQKTLMAFEEELTRRLKDARVFIQRESAEETMRGLMGEVVNRLDKLALDVAEKCNPDNPALAAKVLDAWARKTREELADETPKAQP